MRDMVRIRVFVTTQVWSGSELEVETEVLRTQ